MKQTTKVLLSAVLTIALCVSVISGATFALFTSEASTNIAVTAGKVNVTAVIDENSLELYSMGEKEEETDANGNKLFANKGTAMIAKVDNVDTLTLTNITPGDAVKFNINMTNGSNVAIKYRLTWTINSEFAGALEAFVGEVNGTQEVQYTQIVNNTSAWADWATTDATTKTLAVKLNFPVDAGDDYQGAEAQINFKVEAVQGNGADLYGGTFVGGDKDDVKDELTADKENIHVVLTDDVTYDVAAWANDAMGGTSTKTVTIDGQGHTITFNQTDSDWNNIVTNGAKLIIKNAHITNSGYNDGPWNRHDLNFACDVELINVTSDKALAFKAGATLKNVTINDKNTSDTYAIWIQPNGQTVDIDGLTVDMLACSDGRGIKIDEQYVSSPAKVTLNVKNATFKTEEKSAILVKSAAGAEITLAKVDISGVVADPINAVWVDEASASYKDLVTVTGGTVVVEGTFALTEVAEGVYENGTRNYYVSTAKGLQNVFAQVIPANREQSQTVNLMADVDLTGIIWQPISNMHFTFNGNGHTISNVTCAEGWRSGFFGYAGGVTVNDLTLENVKSAGAQAGTFAGSTEGLTTNNCFLKGTNTVTYVPYKTADYEETYGGIGAVTGVLASSNINVTIVEGATVTLIKSGMTTNCTYVNDLTGYLNANNGTVVNNGTVINGIATADDLLALGGKSIEGYYALVNNIDLNGATIATIGAKYGKVLNFDGNGYTISNGTTAHTSHNGMKHHGLFYAYTNSTFTVTDLVIDNVDIDATNDTERNYGVGVVVAFADGGSNVTLKNVDIKNCDVKNNTPDIGDEAGVYVGYQTGTLTMIDCDSTSCTVAGETAEKTGAFIGMVNGTATVTNCTTDLTIGTCNRVAGTLTEN